ncbi:MAG: hypothetical protein ACXVGB_00650 [Mycobacteriaceae bacterium]
MSLPPQQPPAAPAAAAPDGPPAGSKPSDTYTLHSCALKAQTAVEKLATELAHAGVDRKVTSTVTAMADAIRQIVSFTGGKPEQAQPAQPAQPQQHTMSSAANSLVADVAARKAQGGH